MKQSDYIKSLINAKNLRMKDVALKLGIKPSSLSLKINGRRRFKDNEVKILLGLLQMSYEEVFMAKEIKIIENDKKVISVDNTKYTVSEPTVNKILDIIKEEVI